MQLRDNPVLEDHLLLLRDIEICQIDQEKVFSAYSQGISVLPILNRILIELALFNVACSFP